MMRCICLPDEILLKISGYYASPEKTIAYKCNISKLVNKYKLNKIKQEQQELIKQRTIIAINKLYI